MNQKVQGDLNRTNDELLDYGKQWKKKDDDTNLGAETLAKLRRWSERTDARYRNSSQSQNSVVKVGTIRSDEQQQILIPGVKPRKEFLRNDYKPVKKERPIPKKPVLLQKQHNAFLQDLEITVDRIKSLTGNEEEDEYGEIINPTEYAIETAIELVSAAAKLVSYQFFKAWVSTEDLGGVRLTWSKPDLEKQVRLVIPSTPNLKRYLYHEISDEYGIVYNFSAKTLSHWLSWCNPK